MPGPSQDHWSAAAAAAAPITTLHADPHEVSEQITRIVAAFRARLAMQPPSQLLSDTWTFTKALRLPDQQLQVHLNGLLQLVGGDVAAAQRLAQQHAGVLLSTSFAGMLPRVEKLGDLLGLQQVATLLIDGLLMQALCLAGGGCVGICSCPCCSWWVGMWQQRSGWRSSMLACC
jgi:hypothetical protein